MYGFTEGVDIKYRNGGKNNNINNNVFGTNIDIMIGTIIDIGFNFIFNIRINNNNNIRNGNNNSNSDSINIKSRVKSVINSR